MSGVTMEFVISASETRLAVAVPAEELHRWEDARFEHFFEAVGMLVDVIHAPRWTGGGHQPTEEPPGSLRDEVAAPAGKAQRNGPVNRSPASTNGSSPSARPKRAAVERARRTAASAARRRVVELLHDHDGRFADAGGHVLRRLADELGYKSVGGLSHLLAGMQAEGLIEREIRGRRTYCVRLEPAGLALVDAGTVSVHEVSAPGDAEVLPSPPPRVHPPSDDEIARRRAAAAEAAFG